MREIKFRAWDKKEKCWFDEGEVLLRCDGSVWETFANSGGDGIDIEKLDESDYELVRFTGLKDKNGKEIYEGDIVRADWHWEESHEIVWPSDYYDIAEYALDEEDIEVIGNIYENPELLKEK